MKQIGKRLASLLAALAVALSLCPLWAGGGSHVGGAVCLAG